MDYHELSDERLIEMYRKNRSDEITDHIIEKYKNMVRKKARAMYLIGGDTDDLIQEGMIGLFKAIRDYDESREASFQTFARLCVDRQLYNAVRGSNRKKHQPLNTYISMSSEELETELVTLCGENPEAILIDRENAERFHQKIQDSLSPFENIVLNLYLQGYDYIQIAKMLEKSHKSIDNALQRIRAKVKESFPLDF